MNYDPSDDFQVPTPMIKLQSSDGEIFQVEVKVAQMSLHLKEMLEDLGVDENEVISIPQNAPEISGAILEKIIQWANYHKDDPAAAEDDEKEVKPIDDISNWDCEFLQIDPAALLEIIRAANYLNIKGLLDVTSKKVAKMIKGKTPEKVRQIFDIQNDFSQDEEEQVRKENSWYYGTHLGGNDGRPFYRRVVDEVPANSVQNVDNEGSQVIRDCLSNSVIVRKIFQHLPDHELLKLSTLNKMWNHEARSLMRKRANILARLSCVCHSTQEPCQETFEALGADLRKMNLVPYLGLDICIRPNDQMGGTAILEWTYEAILDRLALKHLSVTLIGEWWNYMQFPALMLLKHFFRDFQEVLEQLTLCVFEEREDFFEHFVGDCNFPSLKVLKLERARNPLSANFTDYMKMWISRDENLQEFHTNRYMNLFQNVLLERRDAVHMHTFEVRAPFAEISESVIDSLRLEKMQLIYTGPEFKFERFNRFTPMLLQASCTTTLREMLVDAVLAVPLMCYGIPLGKVNDLELGIKYDQMEPVQPQILRIVKNMDFTRIFPNVNKVRICQNFHDFQLAPDHMITIIEQANTILREPMPNRAVNIKELDINQSSISATTVQFLSEMFPCTEKLKIRTEDLNGEFPFGSIWKHWVGLRYLEVTGKTMQGPGNLDSVFCGIFPEEVAELRLKDDEYLKSVHIVPVMPAITCLKNLNMVTLNGDPHCREQYVDDGTFIFSKVTALTAFARFPAVTVSLIITSYGAPAVMSHNPLEALRVCEVDPS